MCLACVHVALLLHFAQHLKRCVVYSGVNNHKTIKEKSKIRHKNTDSLSLSRRAGGVFFGGRPIEPVPILLTRRAQGKMFSQFCQVKVLHKKADMIYGILFGRVLSELAGDTEG